MLDSSAIPYGGSEPNPGVYCGVYLGKNVVAYPGDNGQSPAVQGIRIAGQSHYIAGPPALTYQVQCDSATGAGMDTYDEKYFEIEPYTDGLPNGRGMLAVSATDPNTYSGRFLVGINRLMTCFDPRTCRFGVMTSSTGDVANYADQELAVPGVRSPGAPKWVDRANNVVSSNRMDVNAGYGFGGVGNAPPSSSQGWVWDGQLLRFGLFSQQGRSPRRRHGHFGRTILCRCRRRGAKGVRR